MCGEICAVIPLRKHVVFDVYALGYMAWMRFSSLSVVPMTSGLDLKAIGWILRY